LERSITSFLTVINTVVIVNCQKPVLSSHLSQAKIKLWIIIAALNVTLIVSVTMSCLISGVAKDEPA